MPTLNEALESISPNIKTLVEDAKSLYQDKFPGGVDTFVTCAPGRVNLIGEHTDYTGGFVFPLAIDYSTVVYGSGKVMSDNSLSKIQMVSKLNPRQVDTITLSADTPPPPAEEAHSSWTWYVAGVVAIYLKDLPSDSSFDIAIAVAGNVPLGGGLSSSASLEVAVARFLECILDDKAFSGEQGSAEAAKVRALRCQKAENVYCHSPCGIMDQYISSAGQEGCLLLIDCTSFEYTKVQMKQPNTVQLVVTNSCVTHAIGAGEYPVRVAQCKTATKVLQEVHGEDSIKSLRDAKLEQVLQAKEKMDDVSFRRARHVVTENARTTAAKKELEGGNWVELGKLMNGSHLSMKDDYEVSCEEVDILADLAQNFEGVYGSRLTGGGFGGCTVTLVEEEKASDLIAHLKAEYKAKTGRDCICFTTSPGTGARLIATDSV